ncbi:MAG TPA: MaoC/PaaZ C-terminal domain-containing protein [Solirubrobacteraceae bacterium]|jgi:acyl dehydratase|nr:MaoC/PaaZ C-terminal domain-containing protein [Solirubrobacteraceae bacterium]
MTTADRTRTRLPVFERPFDELERGEALDSVTRRVTAGDVLEFAELTGDRHPVHVDPEWAAGSRFGRQIAHGMLVLSMAFGAFPFDGRWVVALRRVRDVTFKRPVAAGTEILVEAAVDALAPVDSGTGLVTFRLTVRDEDGRTCVRGLIDVVWRRGAAA